MSGRKISLFIPLSSGAENASTWCSSPAPRKLDLQKTNTLGAVEIFMMVNKKSKRFSRQALRFSCLSEKWSKNTAQHSEFHVGVWRHRMEVKKSNFSEVESHWNDRAITHDWEEFHNERGNSLIVATRKHVTSDCCTWSPDNFQLPYCPAAPETDYDFSIIQAFSFTRRCVSTLFVKPIEAKVHRQHKWKFHINVYRVSCSRSKCHRRPRQSVSSIYQFQWLANWDVVNGKVRQSAKFECAAFGTGD